MEGNGKVIGVGFQKTGTSTLGEALQILGYRLREVQLDLAEPLMRGDLQPVWDRMEGYDAFEDNPWALLYREIDQRFPGSKFILTWRDEERWIRSVLDHFGRKSTRMREWVYDGRGSPEGNETFYLERYRRHNKEVAEYFRDRPGDLLTVNFEEGDAWEKLCDHLGHDIPDRPFPHANPRPRGLGERVVRDLRKRMKRWKGFGGGGDPSKGAL